MFRRSSTHKKLFAALALVTASIGATVISGHSPVHAVSGTGGLISMSAGHCTGTGAIDASSANWSWTKPTLEYSTDGTTWTAAAGTNYGMQLCRDVSTGAGGMVQAYWFIVQQADGNDDMVNMPNIANTTFRITIPLKSGDNTTRLTGYSEMVSLSEANGVATVLTKASGLAKVNWQGLASFKAAHPECSSATDQTWSQCNIQKADRDIQYMVIQHLEYSTSALTSFQQIYKGLWIGANVNGYNVNLQCGALGGDSSNGGGNNGGGNYSGNSDGGANMNSGSSAAKSLEVSVNGTPHLTAAGAINKGSLKAFIPGETATKCFGDGAATTTLQTIAEALSVSRTEASENGGAAQSLAAGTAFTAEAVTTPVAGILVKVPEMTFSSPSYKVTSKLATTTTGSTTSSTAKALAKGKKAKLKSLITTTKGATLTWSVKGGCKIVGTNLVATKKAATCTLKVKEKVTKKVNGKKKTTTTSQSVTITVS